MNITQGQPLERHSKIRNTQIIKSVASTLIAKFVIIGSSILTIPLTLKYLGIEQFGAWMAISSFVSFLSFADMGLGIGLQNSLSECHGKNDTSMAGTYISSSYFVVTLFSIVILLIFGIIYLYYPVEHLIKEAANDNSHIIRQTFMYVLTVGLIGVPTGLIQRILNGYQKGGVSSGLNLIGSIVSLCSILVSVYLELPLPFLGLLFASSQVAVNLLYTVIYFVKNKNQRPTPRLIHLSAIKKVSGIGIWAVLAQVTFLLRTNAPVLFISHAAGAAAVAQYTTTQKVFGLSGVLISMALQSLWPAYAEAYFRGDKKWMLKTFNKALILIAVLSVPAFVLLQLFGATIIRIWTNNPEVLPSFTLLMLCNISWVGFSFVTAFMMVSNGTNNFKLPTTLAFFFTVIAAGISCFSAQFIDIFQISFATSAEFVVLAFVFLCDLLPIIFLFPISRSIITSMRSNP